MTSKFFIIETAQVKPVNTIWKSECFSCNDHDKNSNWQLFSHTKQGMKMREDSPSERLKSYITGLNKKLCKRQKI